MVLSRLRCGAHGRELDAERRNVVRQQQCEQALEEKRTDRAERPGVEVADLVVARSQRTGVIEWLPACLPDDARRAKRNELPARGLRDVEPLVRFQRATYGLRNRITSENPGEFSRSVSEEPGGLIYA